MRSSTNALSTTTICAPTGIWWPKCRFNLQPLYWKNGKVVTTDGPYAETKEQLGGIQILEARDLSHAIQLISQLPGFKYGLGPMEIRPAADLNEILTASEQRRRRNTTR
jgi:hypothetical protein